MDLVFFNYNDKVNLANIPLIDELKFLNGPEFNERERKPLTIDAESSKIMRKILFNLRISAEWNKKLIKIMENFLAKLKEMLDIQYHENLHLILNSYIENNEILTLHRKFIECAFISKIDSDTHERIFTPYIVRLAKKAVEVLTELRTRRAEISLTTVLIFNVSKDFRENEFIYFGVGFVNYKTETLLLLEEFRISNYHRNKISNNLIPKISPNNIARIICTYVAVIRGFLFSDDGNIKEKDLQQILISCRDNILSSQKEGDKKIIESLQPILESGLPGQKKIYVIDISKVDFTKTEFRMLFLMTTLFYTLDLVWKKLDLEASYCCEVFQQKLIFVFHYNQILNDEEYNDKDTLTRLSQQISNSIQLMNEQPMHKEDSRELSFEEKPVMTKKKEPTDSFANFFKRNKPRQDKTITTIISNSLNAAAKWSGDGFQEQVTSKIQTLNFHYLPPEQLRNTDFHTNVRHSQEFFSEKPIEELKRFMSEKGLLNTTLVGKDYFENLHSELQHNIVLINYYLLPKLYFYFLIASRQTTNINDIKLVEFHDEKAVLIMRKVIEYFLYEEGAFLRAIDMFILKKEIVREFFNIFIFKLVNPYNSNHTLIKSKWTELLDRYLEVSFANYLRNSDMQDDASQILVLYLKTCLLLDENDEFLELLLLQIKPVFSLDYTSLNPNENQLTIKYNVYGVLLDNQILDSLPSSICEAITDMSERLSKMNKDEKLKLYILSYLCGIYFHVLLSPLFEGKNANYLSYTNKNNLFLSRDVIDRFGDIFNITRQVLGKYVQDFESKLKIIKEKVATSNKYRVKKQVSVSMVCNCFLSGANLNFLFNMLKFMIKLDDKSPTFLFLKNYVEREPKFFELFDQMSDRYLTFVISINTNLKDVHRELDEYHQISSMIEDKRSLQELLALKELIPFSALLSNFENQIGKDTKKKESNSWDRIQMTLEMKKDVIKNFLSLEDPLYAKLKELIPMFNSISQQLQKGKSAGRFNDISEHSDEQIRLLIRYQDDLSKYHKLSKTISDYAARIQERINLLNMNIDFVENFSDIADLLREAQQKK